MIKRNKKKYYLMELISLNLAPLASLYILSTQLTKKLSGWCQKFAKVVKEIISYKKKKNLKRKKKEANFREKKV